MIKQFRIIWSMFVLFTGVVIAMAVTSTYLLTAGLFVGAPAAMLGSIYWLNVYFAFDCLWNAILGGSYKEMLSSRLGKSTVYNYDPVLWNRWADKTLAWILHQVDKHHCEKSIDWTVGEDQTRWLLQQQFKYPRTL